MFSKTIKNRVNTTWLGYLSEQKETLIPTFALNPNMDLSQDLSPSRKVLED